MNSVFFKTSLLIASIFLISGCRYKPCYRCKLPDLVGYVCESSADTVRYIDWGRNKILLQKVANRTAEGYNCYEIPVNIIHWSTPHFAADDCLRKDDYQYYTWVGYDCYKTNEVK